MKNKLSHIYSFTEENHYKGIVWLFRRCMYLFLLVQVMVLLPEAAYFFSPSAFMQPLPVPEGVFGKLLTLINHPNIAEHYHVFIFCEIGFLLLGLTGKAPVISSIGIYLFTMNLFRKGIEIQNGGWHIVGLLLFFNLFFIEKKANNPTNIFYVCRNVAANLSVWGAKVQIAILYLVAGFYKLQGELWLKGEAMYYIFQTDAYNHPLLQNQFFLNDITVFIASWFGLAYQLLFPLLIWFNPIKKPLLLAGVFFHLFIAFGMGLMDFGFAMLVSYSLFLYQPTAEKIKIKLTCIF